jgi:hypothetical protein
MSMSSVLDIACPHDGCSRQFGSDRALRIHVESAHADDGAALERVREALHMTEICETPKCGKAKGHKGRHANQGAGQAKDAPKKAVPRSPKTRKARARPKPKAAAPTGSASPNGQLVRVTLTVPLEQLLRVATVEKVEST